MKSNTEHYRVIRNANENNKLAVFIGSGVSYDSNLPSWDDLINQMKNSLDSPGTDNYLKIAEYYYLEYGRNSYYKKLNDYFPADSKPNELHSKILSLRPQHIVTTNWDDLIEKAIRNSGQLYFPVATDHELASSPRSQLLIKMHGDLTHRNIVFKESDYLSYSDCFPLIENFLKSLFSNHVVLFIGYSITDFNLNQILNWIRNRTGDAPPAFTILTKELISLYEYNYLKEKGVYPILVDENSNCLEIHHPSLSKKSNAVFQILHNIINVEPREFLDVLQELLLDTDAWELLHPAFLTRLIKSRLNLNEVNKIYYDSSYNQIIYRLSEEELKLGRDYYRSARKTLIQLLRKTPIQGIKLKFKNKSIKINNLYVFNFIDKYNEFATSHIANGINTSVIAENKNINKAFQYAFDNYYLKNYSIASEIYSQIANIYFSNSQFVKSLISAYNKKHLWSGNIPHEDFDEFLNNNEVEIDSISELLERFPNSILNRQNKLFQGLDENNTFILEQFRIIAILSRKVDQEILKMKKGTIYLSSDIYSLYHNIYVTMMFIHKNKLALISNHDYGQISRIGFESWIKRSAADKKPNINPLIAYSGIISFEFKELYSFISENLPEETSIQVSQETVQYLNNILNNIISSLQDQIIIRRSLRAKLIKVWSNSLVLLSYIKPDQVLTNQIIDNLIKALDTKWWFQLSSPINLYLVHQIEKQNTEFSRNQLDALFDKQMQKILNLESISYQENGMLFSNLLYLIKNKNTQTDSSLFEDNKKLNKFISNVEEFDFKDRLNAIRSFIYSIYLLAEGDLKEKIKMLLTNTYLEAKKRTFDELSIIFSLNLINIDVIEETELNFILTELRRNCKDHIQNKSSTQSYSVFKEQLSKLDKNKLEGFDDVLKDVDYLSDKFNSIFS